MSAEEQELSADEVEEFNAAAEESEDEESEDEEGEDEESE